MITAVFPLTLCAFMGLTGTTLHATLYMFKVDLCHPFIHIHTCTHNIFITQLFSKYKL
jgi:hypothetical protein